MKGDVPEREKVFIQSEDGSRKILTDKREFTLHDDGSISGQKWIAPPDQDLEDDIIKIAYPLILTWKKKTKPIGNTLVNDINLYKFNIRSNKQAVFIASRFETIIEKYRSTGYLLVRNNLYIIVLPKKRIILTMGFYSTYWLFNKIEF